MTQENKLPDPDTHCWDDDSSNDVWSYSPDLVRQIIETDRAQRGEPVAWMFPDDLERFESSETFAQAYSVKCGSPTQGTTLPLYTVQQPERKHTEEEVQEILDSSLREWGVFEATVRDVLGVPKT